MDSQGGTCRWIWGWGRGKATGVIGQGHASKLRPPTHLSQIGYKCSNANMHVDIASSGTYRHIYIYISTQSCARKALTATKWDEVLPMTGLERHVGTPNPTSSSASHDHKTNGKHVHGRCLGRNGYGTNYIRCCSKCAHTLAQNKLEDEPGIRIPYSGCRKKKETNHNQYIYISIYICIDLLELGGCEGPQSGKCSARGVCA